MYPVDLKRPGKIRAFSHALIVFARAIFIILITIYKDETAKIIIIIKTYALIIA